MFHYISKKKSHHKIVVQLKKFTDRPDCLDQIAQWSEAKWGYLRNHPGTEFRKQLITKLKDSFYIITYQNEVVGMFALLETHSAHVLELCSFYVDEPFRGFGVGKTLFKLATEKAVELNARTLIFDTLTPNLNKFYKECGATFTLHADRSFKVTHNAQTRFFPTTFFQMNLEPVLLLDEKCTM